MAICCRNVVYQVKGRISNNKEEEEKGAYLVFDNASNGTLFIVWKKEKVENALMFIKPTKEVPEFKFVNRNGKNELIRNLQSDKKLFYSGICQFVKEAKDIKGKLTLLQHFDSSFPIKVDLYFLKGSKVMPLNTGEPFVVQDIDAMSVLPKGSSSLKVKTMAKDMFVSRGNTEGASISF